MAKRVILTQLVCENRYPGVAQLVARLTGGQEAVSSSLATRTKGQVLIGLAFFIAGVFPLHGTVHLPLSFPPTRRRTYSLLHYIAGGSI